MEQIKRVWQFFGVYDNSAGLGARDPRCSILLCNGSSCTWPDEDPHKMTGGASAKRLSVVAGVLQNVTCMDTVHTERTLYSHTQGSMQIQCACFADVHIESPCCGLGSGGAARRGESTP